MAFYEIQLRGYAPSRRKVVKARNTRVYIPPFPSADFSFSLLRVTFLASDQEIHFLFSMEDSRDAFNIPHDLRIYKEVFNCERATRENEFWKAYDLPKVN